MFQVKQNDMEQAANAILNQENISEAESATTWDESAFTADREGNNQNLHALGTSAAPTRGPSPAPSLGIQQPKSKADEDSEMAAAMALSLGDTSYRQESGSITQDGTEIKAFGPATREHYEQNQWAMVPHGGAQEIVPDVPAQERIHSGDAPRLLKHLPDGDYTPNLLTICHAIPKAREAFLMRDYLREDYGYDPEWWHGHPIPMPRIVHTQDGSPAQPDMDKYDEFIAETQRLIAFLDLSQRIYATVGGLTQTEVVKNSHLSAKTGSLLELFLSGWVVAASSKLRTLEERSQVAGLFTSMVGTTAREGMDHPDMTVVEMSVDSEDSQKTDLYELLDNLLWDTDSDDADVPDNYIEQPAEILVMKIHQRNSNATRTGVEVPATLHVDKYLKENVASTKSIRREMAQGKKRVAKIEELENKLKNWQHPTKSTQLDARQLLEHSIGRFSNQDRLAAMDNAPLTNGDQPDSAEVAYKLRQVVVEIDKKLEVLAQEKEKTKKAVSEMSRSPPRELSEIKHCYTLRGVATKPHITYVLSQKRNSDVNMSQEQHHEDWNATPNGYEWWRLDYEVSAAATKVTRTKADDYDVLRAVELEGTSALLVYASEEANDPDYFHGDVPQPLQDFVARDNAALADELQNLDHAPPAYDDYEDIPMQSTEQRRASDDSMNVNMADNDHDPEQHSSFGLGYGRKAETSDPPVAEIHLSPPTESLLDDEGGTDVEMVEYAHEPLLPRPATGHDAK